MSASAQAQQTPPVAPVPGAQSLQDLSKSLHNPFEDSIKLPIEATSGFSIGSHHDAGEALNIEPVVPFLLNDDWLLIARPNLTLAYLPRPYNESGLTDIQTSFYLTPTSASTWIWGVGPIFQFPTGSSTDLGTGRYSAGPSAGIVYSSGPWFNGVLADQLMSFAGQRKRGSVNETDIEPQVSYNFKSGWYVQSEPSISYDWTAATRYAWTLPVGVDVGKAFNVGSRSLSLQIGAYDIAERPQNSPEWIARVQITLLFPTGK
jgi:hypothetical protein